MQSVLSNLFHQLRAIKLFGFSLFSFLGFIIDFLAFLILLFLGFSVIYSNIIGGALGVSFVYFSSGKYIFFDDSKSLLTKFFFYVLWNGFRVYFLSLIIASSSQFFDVFPLLPKIIVVPISMYLNFLFMHVLMTKEIKFY